MIAFPKTKANNAGTHNSCITSLRFFPAFFFYFSHSNHMFTLALGKAFLLNPTEMKIKLSPQQIDYVKNTLNGLCTLHFYYYYNVYNVFSVFYFGCLAPFVQDPIMMILKDFDTAIRWLKLILATKLCLADCLSSSNLLKLMNAWGRNSCMDVTFLWRSNWIIIASFIFFSFFLSVSFMLFSILTV